MGEVVARIERLENGFEVEIYDPKLAKKNSTSKGAWVDPMKGYSFKTVAEVCEFLEVNLDKAVPNDEYGTTFDALVKEEEADA